MRLFELAENLTEPEVPILKFDGKGQRFYSLAVDDQCRIETTHTAAIRAERRRMNDYLNRVKPTTWIPTRFLEGAADVIYQVAK